MRVRIAKDAGLEVEPEIGTLEMVYDTAPPWWLVRFGDGTVEARSEFFEVVE